MANQQVTLEAEHTYHIYNRANGDDILFKEDENYRFFLKKYDAHISPIADTFCYCLMPNHFHFLLRIKTEKELHAHYSKKDKSLIANLQGFENLAGLNAQQFSNFFNSYTKAFNKKYSRKGSLFMRNFKRKEVDVEQYLRKFVHYIHYNPIEAFLTKRPEEYSFSSYKSLISNAPTQLHRNEVLKWFDDRSNFIYCHKHSPSITGIENHLHD